MFFSYKVLALQPAHSVLEEPKYFLYFWKSSDDWEKLLCNRRFSFQEQILTYVKCTLLS